MNKLFGVLFMATVLSIFSCQKEEPVIENEQEVITTLHYTLTASGGQTAVFSFQDLDGDGGNAPIISVDSLQANTTYTGQVVLLNETVTPADSISAEVLEEALDHQFFFTTTDPNVSVNYADLDIEGKPIGLQTVVTTSAAGHGTMTIILKHEPNKSGANVFLGDMTNAGGETDIEVTFDVHVQ